MECQLESLRRCLSISTVRKTLSELPKTLDDTYDRILVNIPKEYIREAQCAIQLLAISYRLLTVDEVAEAVAVDCEHDTFDTEMKLLNPESILEICGSLVALSGYAELLSKLTLMFREELCFAHYSVKEYLLSKRIFEGVSHCFGIADKPAHQFFARLSLVYLLQFSQQDSVQKEAFQEVKEFPLLDYSAHFWHEHIHASAIKGCQTQEHNLIRRLFDSSSNCLINCLTVYDPDNPYRRKSFPFPTSLYYSSLLGLLDVTDWLLEKGPDVNAKGGNYGNALQAASQGGHEMVVRLLLDKGVDVNAQGGYYGNALQAASAGGHEVIVRLLLEKGAKVKEERVEYSNHEV